MQDRPTGDKLRRVSPPSLGQRLMLLGAAGLAHTMMDAVLHARPYRVDLIPNGNRYGCSTCHDSGGGGPRNDFGYAVEQVAIGSQPFWDAALAALDSDRDGFTNGEELGDPDGDGIIDPRLVVSHPGNPLSFPISPPVLQWEEKPTQREFWEGDQVRVSINASDEDGIQFVVFEWSESVAGPAASMTVRDRTPPYEGIWTVPIGSWQLKVSALDAIGASSELPACHLVVKPRESLKVTLRPLTPGVLGLWKLSWRGGKGPYEVRRARRLGTGSEGWESVVITPGMDYVWAPDANQSFFQVLDLGQAAAK